MTVLTGILIGLATGIVFGFALEKSRVFEPGVIVGQMQLRSFIMLKVFLAAVVTGLVILAVMNGTFGVPLQLKPLLWQADIIGGLVLGAGIALAGACPGTSLAQIGAGYRDAWFTVLGGIAGAIAYGYLDEPITAFFAEKGAKLTFADLAGLPFWQAALGAAVVLAVLLAVIEWLTPWRKEIGENVDGVLPERGEAGAAGGVAHQH
jgi:uncharacterized membrane protein YedE/YeeE